MQVRELAVADVYEFTPRVFPDDRGLFVAPFQEAAFLDAVGFPLRVAQTNHSVSRRGVIRGMHFADVPPGQSKFVYCPLGALIDVVIDLRVGSPTFGEVDSVLLDSTDYRGVYVSEGIGHGFVALTDDTVMAYSVSTGYNPTGEHCINPLDPAMRLPWPADIEPVLSDKDAIAPNLADALATGMLPKYEECVAYYDELRIAAKNG
jgi:epimerase EvaD